MLSVVLYGRNDSHGYNLHKRAAIEVMSRAVEGERTEIGESIAGDRALV